MIELWDSRDALASDVGAKDRAVSKWWQRDSIPASWWPRVCETEKAKTAKVSFELLARLAAKQAETEEARP